MICTIWFNFLPRILPVQPSEPTWRSGGSGFSSHKKSVPMRPISETKSTHENEMIFIVLILAGSCVLPQVPDYMVAVLRVCSLVTGTHLALLLFREEKETGRRVVVLMIVILD